MPVNFISGFDEEMSAWQRCKEPKNSCFINAALIKFDKNIIKFQSMDAKLNNRFD